MADTHSPEPRRSDRVGWRNAESAERGSVTAEFAVALPAVLLLFAILLGAVRLGANHVAAQDLAADAARALGRGESVSAVAARVAREVPGAELGTSRAGGLACASVYVAGLGPVEVLGVRVSARSCAWDRGG